MESRGLAKLTANDLAELTVGGLNFFSPDQLAFLFSVGKIELLVRNLLVQQIAAKVAIPEDQAVVREWKRHDLAFLQSGQPTALFEGKAWLHSDAVSQSKLDQSADSIWANHVSDIAKIRETYHSGTKAKAFITMILSSVNVEKIEPELRTTVSYFDTHARGIKQSGSFEQLRIQGNQNMVRLLEKHGQVISGELFSGEFAGAEVVADYFMLELNPESY
jgi:hypothetical protein